MSNVNDDRDSAYKLYHSKYDNKRYQNIQKSLIITLCGAFQVSTPGLIERALNVPEINNIMNLVTDCCLEICGHPDMQGRSLQLAETLITQTRSGKGVDMNRFVRDLSIAFEAFEEDGSNYSANFEHRYLSILYLGKGQIKPARVEASILKDVDQHKLNEILAEIERLTALYEAMLLNPKQ